MKIVDVRATPVLVPLKQPLRWSFGVETATVRTVIELTTDEGLVGIGETRGGERVARAVEASRDFFIGGDPLEAARVAKRYGFYRVTSEQLDLVGAMKLAGAGVEMACWDLAGRALGKRCGDLWGGIDKQAIEVAAYAFYRGPTSGQQYQPQPEDPAEHALELVETHGFRDVKFKNGVLPPKDELRAIECIQDRLGDRLNSLRIDPNQAWSVETSIRFLRTLSSFQIEFCEDPTWGIEGMSLVRERVGVPLATNMCCVSFEQIPQAVARRAIDIVLGDVHFWGGPTAVMQLAKICETFNLGLSLHSDRELGISTAAMLHLAAALPSVSHSIDSHLPEQADDIITAPHQFLDGRLAVPHGPGLGVELDHDKLNRYAQLYQSTPQADEFRDPSDPTWWPKLPLF